MQQTLRHIVIAILGLVLLSCVPTASEDFGMPEGEKAYINVPLRSSEEAEPRFD